MSARFRAALATLLIAVLALLPSASAGDAQQWDWAAGREVRVATGPTLRPLPSDDDKAAPLPTLAHGYAALAARHSGLNFVDLPYPSTQAGIAAVCAQQADLVLVQGKAATLQPPCADLVASRGFRAGRTALVGRAGERLPHDADDLGTVLLAAVEGGPYPAWLGKDYPGVRVLPMPSQHAALTAVDAGVADAAIGLESTLRPLARRHFNGRLRLQVLDSQFPSELHLLTRRENQHLLDRIEQSLLDITIDEHAVLLQRWARQALPAAVGSALLSAEEHSTFWWSVPALLLVGTPMLLHRLIMQRRRREQTQAHMVGVLSHEVRNSAQAVIASIDLLAQTPLPAGPRELVVAATSAGNTLRGLLNRALDFSRVASGTFEPQPRACAPVQLCEQAIEAIAPHARRRGLTLRLNTPPAPFPHVLADPDCLRQILDNLLGNAMKFTDVGGIELRLALEDVERSPTLLLEVIDSGIGIGPNQMARLFQPFTQADAGRERGGSGLGLSICRELARAMGGDLDAHSVHGRGSRFILRVPVEVLDAAAPDAEEDASALPLSGISILLVEDHDLSRRVVAEQLRRQGMHVTEACDATSALAQQAATPSAAVLLDIGLRNSCGYALAERLRALEDGNLPRSQLLALSAQSGAAHLRRCRQAGIDAVLTKPLQMERLMLALGRNSGPGNALPDTHASLEVAYECDIQAGMRQVQVAINTRNATELAHHAHRLLGVLQMRGAADMASVAGDLWELGSRTTPDWNRAQGLLQELNAKRGAGKPGASPAS